LIASDGEAGPAAGLSAGSPTMTPARTLLTLSVGLLLAGCGGEERLSKSEYEQKVQVVYADVQQAFRETNVKAQSHLADRVEAAQEQLREASEELEAVEPPKDVEEDNEEIVEGMRDYADDLDELREAAARGDRGAIESFNARIAEKKSVRKIAEAAEEMKFKGYDLGPIAEE
jgi:hypothetical protein